MEHSQNKRKIKIISQNSPKLILFSQFDMETPADFSGECYLTVDTFDYDNIDEEINKFIQLLKISNLKEVTIYSRDVNVFKIVDLILKENNFGIEINYFLEKSDKIDADKIREFNELNNPNKQLSYEYIMYAKDNKVSDFYIPIMEENHFLCNKSAINLTLNPSSFENLQSLQEEIYRIINAIFKGLNVLELDDLDKSIIVSNYIQNNIQYIAGRISSGDNKEYICERFKGDAPESHWLINLLNENNYGVCGNISLLTLLLLDNPLVKCNCQFIASPVNAAHYFLTQIIDGKEYVVDNTWNITRNRDKHEGSLKARSFSTDFLLIGQDKLNESEDIRVHHVSATRFLYPIENESIPREKIQASVEKLLKMGVKFDNYKPPMYEQRILEKSKTI